jgi:hypothetical protein
MTELLTILSVLWFMAIPILLIGAIIFGERIK